MATIDALIDGGGLKSGEIAFFTQRDNSGFAMGVAALKRPGLNDPGAILYTCLRTNTLAVEDAVADLLTAEKPPPAVMVYGAYAACAKFIKLCRDADLNPLFLNAPLSAAVRSPRPRARRTLTSSLPRSFPIRWTIPFLLFANIEQILGCWIPPLRRISAMSRDISPAES